MTSRPLLPAPRAAWVATAVLVTGLMAACSAPPPSGAVPAMPPGVTAPDEYAFGDEVASRDLDAWGPVYDAIAEEVDEERRRNLPLVLDADVDVAEVRDAYDSELVGPVSA